MNTPTPTPTAAQSEELAARRAAEDADRALTAARADHLATRTPAAYAASSIAFERWFWAARRAASLAALLPPTSHL